MDLGIIGGADGPTAVLVASPAVNPWVIAAIVGVCAAAVFTAILIIKNKKKK